MKIKLCAFADEAGSDLQEQIDALIRNEIEYIELRGINGKNVSQLSDEEARQYYTTLTNAGIKVWSIGSPIGKVDCSIDINEYLVQVERICQIARIFNCNKIRMFSFFNAYSKREIVMENLKKMVQVASKYDVTLYHENEKDVYGDTVQRVLDVMNSVKGLKFVYDPANFVQVGQTKESFLPLVNKCDYYHIKDALSDGSVVPAGYGEGGLKELICSIQKDTVLTIEPHLKVFAGYADIDGTQLKNKFVYETNSQAFDSAVSAIKQILIDCGFTSCDGFIK